MSVDRTAALALLHEHTKTDSLRKHAYAVEAAMRAMSARMGGDADLWGATGLLHDFDYEAHPAPDAHPYVGVGILRELGYPAALCEAILGHAEYTGVARTSDLAKALFAVDELCGLVTAVALVRPSKSIHDVTPKSVKKKLAEKSFARSVSREDIRRGAEELGVDLTDQIAFVIEALRGVAPVLGLEGDGIGGTT